MVDFNTFINKKITEIKRIDKKGAFTKHLSRGLCIGVNENEKYLVIAVKRLRLICELLSYDEVSEIFPRFEINDIALDEHNDNAIYDFFDYFLGQQIISIRFHNDINNSNKSFFLMITNNFKLGFDNSGYIEIDNRDNN